MKLHISDHLSLPLEAVTQTFAILAKRGSGKSYLASVMGPCCRFRMRSMNQPARLSDPR